MNSTKSIHFLVDNTALCVNHSRARLSCASKLDELNIPDDLDDSSRFEDERKGRIQLPFSSNLIATLVRMIHYFAVSVSYAIIALFIYVSLTV